MLFLYVYSILGMAIFGNITLGEELNENANFQTFPSAFMLLFRVSSGEAWPALLLDSTLSSKDLLINCINKPD